MGRKRQKKIPDWSVTDGDREEEMMGINSIKGSLQGTSLAVQWLGLHASNAGGSGSVPGGKLRSHMP